MIIFFVGNHPQIAVAEIKAVYGLKTANIIGERLVATTEPLTRDQLLDQAERLGSVIKIIEIFDTVTGYHDNIGKLISNQFSTDAGKITIGLSIYDKSTSVRLVRQILRDAKNAFRARGGSVRTASPEHGTIIPAARIVHGGLMRNLDKKIAFDLIKANDGRYYLGKTIFAFNPDHYAGRDQARPCRDARNGMLPPKLAQIIINLAIDATDKKLHEHLVVLDPFCGTGVVLQESLLMNIDCIGSDINPTMAEYSANNIAWLQQQKFYNWRYRVASHVITTADATNYDWLASNPITTVACEAYLGKPYHKPPHPDKLLTNIDDCNRIIGDTLRNLASQLPTGAGLCLGVPVWFIGDTHRLLPINNELASLGYHNLSPSQPLIYRRPGQVVGRHLLVLQKS